ncbi:MAG: uracil-DNA glycosylase [Candidatus Izemoplasmataceae bacterium]
MSLWKEQLNETIETTWFKAMLKQLNVLNQSKVIYPKKEDWFKALSLTPFERVKIVIIGQDPYHQENQAMGLAFSVKKGITIPPSLRNIYKELASDLGITPPNHGDLTAWAKEGVLLINTTLTVEQSRPLSHVNLGWERFTDAIILALNQKQTPVVYLLWGKHAQSKSKLISNKHLVLKAPHPSPLSAHRGFFGCRHFSKANAFLIDKGIEPVNFNLTA